jgi:hypothetical protein
LSQEFNREGDRIGRGPVVKLEAQFMLDFRDVIAARIDRQVNVARAERPSSSSRSSFIFNRTAW